MADGGTRTGFLGAGRMATALARAWTASGRLSARCVCASDPSPAARDAFSRESRCPVLDDNRAVAAQSDLLVLAVKPQTMPAVLAEIRDLVEQRDPLVLSIAAGVTLSQLQSSLSPTTRLIRVMPNTPCLVNASASGYSAGPHATPDDVALVQSLLELVGRAFALPEHLLDAVTGLSGSGPAFVYLVIEAMADGGVKAGLPRDVALALAAQTVLGAAKMVLETGRHPGALKDDVASPAGTTIAGLHELERAAVRGAFIDAVEAASRRAAELGKKG
jgi:pyrroline-5-carboxylate reductase